MNVLLVFGQAIGVASGGHFKSGKSIGAELGKLGNAVSVFLPVAQGGAARFDMFRMVGLRLFLSREKARKTFFGKLYALAANVIRLFFVTLQCRAQVMHDQDGLLIRPVCWVAFLLRRRVVLTIAGGEYKYQCLPRFVPLVVYSEELLAAYRDDRRYQGHVGVHYVRGRIDTTCFRPNRSPREMSGLKNSPDDFIVFMAIRLSADKERWLNSFFTIAAQFAANGRSARFLLAGGGALEQEIKSRAVIFNDRFGSVVKIELLGVITKDDVMSDWMRRSSVFMGNGRSAMEAMACGTPVVILGESGNGERVSPAVIKNIAFWNFSGRHLRDSENELSLEHVIAELFDQYEQCRQDAFRLLDYVERELSAGVGAEALCEVYEKASVPSLHDLLVWERERKRFRHREDACMKSSR